MLFVGRPPCSTEKFRFEKMNRPELYDIGVISTQLSSVVNLIHGLTILSLVSARQIIQFKPVALF